MADRAITEKYISYIKGALVITIKDLKNRRKGQRQDWIIIVLVKDNLVPKEGNQRFKLLEEDKPRINPKYLAYYILLQIAYIDNYYRIYKILKEKYKRYLTRIYQITEEKKISECVVYIRLASNRGIRRKRVGAITRKIPRRRMPRGTRMVGMH